MNSLKQIALVSAFCVGAAQAGAATYDIYMDSSVYIVGYTLPVTATGYYDGVAGQGSWTLTVDLSVFSAPTIQYDQTFTLDANTGTGYLNQATNCRLAPGETGDSSVCSAFSGTLSGTMSASPTPIGAGPVELVLASNLGQLVFDIELDDGGPGVRVTLDVAETRYECEDGGALVNATANVTLLNDAELQSLVWTVDGEPVAGTEVFSDYIELGRHRLEAVATITSGDSSSSATTVTISDTTDPVITAFFSDSRTGAAISSIDSRNTSFVQANFGAIDACDSDVEVKAFGGFPLSDRDLLKIQGNQDKVELTASMLEMLVQAVDASGNSSQQLKTLTISD